MSVIVARFVKAPTSLEWWAYPSLAGMLGLAAVLGGLLAGGELSGWIVGLALHTVLDFTLQSDWIAMNKNDRGKALLFHAIIAGGLPGAMKGLMTGGLVGCLVGVVIGIASHYAIDYTRKFNCESVALGVILDQVAHLAILLV